MSDSPAERPEPVSGTTFEASTRKSLVLIGLGLVFVLVSAVLAAGAFGLFTLDDRPTTFKIALIGCILGLGGLFAAGYGGYLIVRNRRAVIGSDRFQFVQRAGGRDVVVAQVMFANVTGLRIYQAEGAKAAFVELADPDAAGTFDAARVIRQRPNRKAFELMIEDVFRGKLEDLLESLDAAVIAWRAEQPDA